MNYNKNIVVSAKKLIIDCLDTKKEEKLLIVTDEKNFNIAYPFAVAGRELGINTSFIEATSQTKGEPPSPVAAAIKNTDVAFFITSMSYSHVKARIEANEKGVRIASMPMLTEEIADNYLDTDYKFIKEISDKLANMMKDVEIIKIKSKLGTNLEFSVKGRTPLSDTGFITEKGAIGNLPAGEAYIAPIENSANGTLVVDGCIAYLGTLEDNIELTIKDGYIVDIKGNNAKERFIEFLKDKDDEARGIAEFGIGTNPAAKIIGHPLLDEKVWGTIHIAFGMNSTMGGTRDSNIHYDCIINNPTVYFDNIKIIEEGEHIY